MATKKQNPARTFKAKDGAATTPKLVSPMAQAVIAATAKEADKVAAALVKGVAIFRNAVTAEDKAQAGWKSAAAYLLHTFPNPLDVVGSATFRQTWLMAALPDDEQKAMGKTLEKGEQYSDDDKALRKSAQTKFTVWKQRLSKYLAEPKAAQTAEELAASRTVKARMLKRLQEAADIAEKNKCSNLGAIRAAIKATDSLPD